MYQLFALLKPCASSVAWSCGCRPAVEITFAVSATAICRGPAVDAKFGGGFVTPPPRVSVGTA